MLQELTKTFQTVLCAVRSSPDRPVWARALAGDIALYLRRDTVFSQCLFYSGVEMNTGEFNAGANPAMD